MRINYDFLDLEAFLAVKDTGSFHLASKRLNLSQSSITRRVRKLEDALGTVLFDRTTREVHPTLAAKRLQIRAEAILQDARETTRAMQDESAAYAHQRTQLITIATIPTVISGLIGPAISAFRNAGHKARFRLMDLAANEVAEAVAQGEADFGIGSIPMLEPVTEFTPLFEDPMVIALPSDHPLSKRETLTWHDLFGIPLILPARGTGNRLLIDEALARSGTPVSWAFEVGRTTTALGLVAQGNGAAVVPQMAVAGISTDRIIFRAVNDPVVVRSIGLLSRLGHKDSASAQEFRKTIVAMVQR